MLLITFKNIKHLNLNCQVESLNRCLIFKIYLPKLESLVLKNSRYLRLFSRLNSLKTINVEKLEKVADIEENIDPTRLIMLMIGNADENKKELLLFFPKLKILNILILKFQDKLDSKYLSSIYNNCSKSINFFEVFGDIHSC